MMDINKEYRDIRGKIAEAGTISTASISLSAMYEYLRRENFVKWIEENPEYWVYICQGDEKDIDVKIATEIMEALDKSNILELQVLWHIKCSDILSTSRSDGEERNDDDGK